VGGGEFEDHGERSLVRKISPGALVGSAMVIDMMGRYRSSADIEIRAKEA
jgi:hypothetical protein